MKLSKILPNFRKAERSSFLGCSGSGKTTFAERVMSIYPYSVVLDTKHDLKWSGYRVFSDIDKLIKAADKEIKNDGAENRFLYRPERGFERDESYELQTKLFEWIWDRKSRAVYIDEATQISTSTRICSSLFDLITRGRSRGISILSGSQRPSGLKQEFLSESENIYCFQLRLPADKEKVLKFGNVDADLIEKANFANSSKHYFVYSKNGAVSKPLILSK